MSGVCSIEWISFRLITRTFCNTCTLMKAIKVLLLLPRCQSVFSELSGMERVVFTCESVAEWPLPPWVSHQWKARRPDELLTTEAERGSSYGSWQSELHVWLASSCQLFVDWCAYCFKYVASIVHVSKDEQYVHVMSEVYFDTFRGFCLDYCYPCLDKISSCKDATVYTL